MKESRRCLSRRDSMSIRHALLLLYHAVVNRDKILEMLLEKTHGQRNSSGSALLPGAQTMRGESRPLKKQFRLPTASLSQTMGLRPRRGRSTSDASTRNSSGSALPPGAQTMRGESRPSKKPFRLPTASLSQIMGLRPRRGRSTCEVAPPARPQPISPSAHGTRGNCEKSGFRFSRNACFPSLPSSLM